MGSKTLRDAAALLVACLIGAGLVEYHHRARFDPHIVWDGFNLPGFDAHVYVAMAEEPRFFTVGPWGYRILLPALVGTILPPRLIAPGFDWTARGSLVFASGLLFVYLRMRGATIRAALLAVLAAMLTPSVEAVFANPFLVEPFALALLLIALIAIEGGAGAWVVALSLLFLAGSKEIWVLLLPLVFVKAAPKGAWPALKRTLLVAAPALWVSLWMRSVWTSPSIRGDAFDYGAVVGSIGSSVPIFGPEYLMGGLSIVALLPLWRDKAREYLGQHLLTLLGLLALPLLAAAYSGGGAATSFFAEDVRRLLIYAVPFMAALAVHLDGSHSGPRAVPASRPLERAAMAPTIALILAPLALDRYARIDLTATRDGPYVLGFVRESLKTARKLDRGETMVFDPVVRKFAWGVSPPSDLSKLRFFLRGGFGPLAHYGIHEIKMRETQATLIVPLLEARALRMSLTMDAAAAAWVTVSADGTRVAEALIGPQAVAVTIEIPGARLFRGDNPIELHCEKAASAEPRILRLEFAQAKR